MPFELIRSETLLKGRAFLIRRDTLKTPDGRETKFDIIEHGGSVVIVPIDKMAICFLCGNIVTPLAWTCLNCPQAHWKRMKTLPYAPHVRSAKKQVSPQTGSKRSVIFISRLDIQPSSCMSILRTELRHDPLEADEDEFLSVEKIPFAEAIQMAERGEMPDAKSLAALLLAKSHLDLK